MQDVGADAAVEYLTRGRRLFSWLALAIIGFLALGAAAHAQTLDPALLKELQRAQAGKGAAAQPSPVDQSRALPEPTELVAQPEPKPEPPSALEGDYQKRGAGIRQYGYDLFSMRVLPSAATVGRIADDYVLGVGDEVIVIFHGSTERSLTTDVDREGRVIIEGMPPITAAGRSFGEVRDEISARTTKAFIGTEAFISLGALRQLSVYVIGEVAHPGLYHLTSLSSVLDALTIAGGVNRTGSLRQIKMVTGGAAQTVDLYRLLNGQGGDLRLVDGARIVVPVIGPTAAVTGEVRRPAIYELSGGGSGKELISVAGGALRPSGYAYVRTRIAPDGRQMVETLADLSGAVADGDILSVGLRRDARIGAVELLGHARAPGLRSLGETPTLKALLRDVEVFQDYPYLLFGVIETTDAATQARLLEPFNPEKVLFGHEDRPLRDHDRVILFGRTDVNFLSSAITRRVVLGGAPSANCPPLGELARLAGDTRSDRFTTAVRAVFTQLEVTDEGAGAAAIKEHQEKADDASCPGVYKQAANLLPFTLEYVASADGAVRSPGVYPLSGDTSIASLVAAAGGTAFGADLSSLEVLSTTDGGDASSRQRIDGNATDLAAVMVRPAGGIRLSIVFRKEEGGAVLLSGEFRHPGVYAIQRGEKLSEIIERAGGLTDQAYPYGVVFTRKRVGEAQAAALQRTARELNAGLVTAVLKSKQVSADVLMAAQQLAEKIATVDVVGRVVAEADPRVLAERPDLDSALEPGDEIHIPKRPNYVLLIGDVLNPGALQFVAGKSVKAYLREGGGIQSTADDDRIFVVYPNGAAKPVKLSSWGFNTGVMVPPGTAIVVPKDVQPIDTLNLVKDITTIVGQLAVSAASIAVISR